MGGEVLPMVPPGQGEGFCLERDGSRDVPAQERPEWVLKSPLGGMWSPCRGKGRKSQEGGGGSGIWAGRQYVNEQWRESLERKVSVCPGTCFISHVPLSSLKPHPIRDIKGAGRGDTPLTPIGQVWSLPTNRRQGVDPVTGSATCGPLGWAHGSRQKWGVGGAAQGTRRQRQVTLR